MKSKRTKAKVKATSPQNRTKSDLDALVEARKRKEARMDATIRKDPHRALRQAREALDYGSAFLRKLIKSKKLFYRLEFADGIDRPHKSHDDAECVLCDRVSGLIREICKLAKEGRFAPVNTTWHGAKEFVETIHDMALNGTVDNLRFIARDSLFLPSLRANAKTFPHDFAEVQEALGLSKDCIVNMDWEALHQLDRPATRFVAEILEDIAHWQRNVRYHDESLQDFQRRASERPGGILDQYRGLTLAEYWLRFFPTRREALTYKDLPPFDRTTWLEWWQKAVKPRLEVRETLESIRGTSFYDEVQKATTSGKDYEVRDELKRRCKPKVKALARPAVSSNPPPV